ncbi:ABC transporter ATP-binding protein [Thermoproteota archaeon]
MNIDHAIITENLSKSWGEVHALKDLNLKVTRNSIIGFLGPNGAGKTTAIKLLLGLIAPTKGNGKIYGKDILKDSIEVRKHIGYLAQEPSYYDYMTAHETLRYKALFYYSGPRDAIEKRVEETLELVELEDKADRPIKGFSGGERQRLGIAQAQIHNPDLLILDEPAANLNPMGRRDVLAIMEKIRHNTTVFYSTHILSDVQRVSDTVAILNHGELVAQDSIENLLTGGAGSVYTFTVKGDPTDAVSQLGKLPWISNLHQETGVMNHRFTVSVSNDDAAETELLRTLLDNGLRVSQFGRRRYDLEDIFMNIVEGVDLD